MNYSDYSLHGISPFYDQTIFVRCHLCRNIVKLPQLADHLDIRHSNNDQNETQIETTNNNSVNLAVNSTNKKGRKANDSNDSSLKTRNAQTPTKVKNSTNETSKTNANNKNVNDLQSQQQQQQQQQKINGSSNELALSNTNTNNSNDNHKLNVVEKIKNKIISSNNTNNNSSSSSKQFVISDSTNDPSLTNNSTNHTNVPHTIVNKSLPKLIIKKDKNSANNEVFYLNNSNSSQQLAEPRLNCINNNSSSSSNNNNHHQIDTNNKFKLNSDTNDLVVNHQKSSLTYSLTKPTFSINTKTKAYDPNKHCGVLIETLDPLTNQLVSQEPCTRSLSCKKHSINLRRAVTGRCKSFNELFTEYKDEKIHVTSSSSSIPTVPPSTDANGLTNVNIEQQMTKPRKTTTNRKKQLSTSYETPDQAVNDHLNQIELLNPSITNSITSINAINNNNNNNAKIRSSPSQLKSFVSIDHNSNKTQHQSNQLKSPSSSSSSSSSAHSPLLPPPPPPPPLPLSLPPHLNSSNLNENLIKLNLNFSNSMLAKHHPRPSAVTSFNARLTDNGGGYTLWNRKQDNLRLVLSNAFSQTSNFLDKNRYFTTTGVSPTSSAGSLLTTTIGSDQLVQTNDLNLNQNSYANHIQQQQLLPQKPQLNQHPVNSFVEVDNLMNSIDNHLSSYPLHQQQQQQQQQMQQQPPPPSKPKVKKTKLLNDDLTNQLPTAAKLAKLNEINYFNKHLTSHHHQLSLNDSDDLDHLERNHLNLIDNASANLLQHYITTNSNRQQTKSASLSPSPSSSSSSSSSSTSSTMTSINLTTNGTNATNAYLLNTFN